MFLRFKRKKTNTPPNTCYYQFILCRSVRECGVPKQRNLKYLGSIGDHYIEIPYYQREFYQEIERNLSDYVAAHLVPVLMAKVYRRFGELPLVENQDTELENSQEKKDR